MAASVDGKVEFSFLDCRHFQHFPILPTVMDANCVCTEATWQWSASSLETHTHIHTLQPPSLKEILLNEPPVELSEPWWTKVGGEEVTGGYGSCWKQLAPARSEGIWRVPSSSPSAQTFLQTWDQPAVRPTEAVWRSGKKTKLCDLAGVFQG